MTTIKLSASIVSGLFSSNNQVWIEVRDANANQFTDPNENALLEATTLALYELQLPAAARTSNDESTVLVEPNEDNEENLLGQSLEYICDAINHGIAIATQNAIASAEFVATPEFDELGPLA